MNNFEGKIAVVTGGGTGMGRELCLQLVSEGCAVATCDVIMENLTETRRLCAELAPDITVTLHQCDVSSESDVNRFRDEVVAEHGDKLDIVFNNAGIAGGGSFVTDEDREAWERAFAVCWYGVYYGSRAFLPLLINSEEGHLVNTSSINGFWATVGPGTPHTAYCSAKFAVKGFTEALMTDLKLHAPHVKAHVVMPGHIGTSIALNSGKVLGKGSAMEMTEDAIKVIRERMMASSDEMSEIVMNLSDDQIREFMQQRAEDFRDKAPTSAGQAATIILDAVKADQWRILVGDDAVHLDKQVRATPEEAYEPSFIKNLTQKGMLGQLVSSGEQ